jgi:hypothetical protein
VAHWEAELKLRKVERLILTSQLAIMQGINNSGGRIRRERIDEVHEALTAKPKRKRKPARNTGAFSGDIIGDQDTIRWPCRTRP